MIFTQRKEASRNLRWLNKLKETSVCEFTFFEIIKSNRFGFLLIGLSQVDSDGAVKVYKIYREGIQAQDWKIVQIVEAITQDLSAYGFYKAALFDDEENKEVHVVTTNQDGKSIRVTISKNTK